MSEEQKKQTLSVFEVRKFTSKAGNEVITLQPKWSKPDYKKGIKQVIIELNDGSKHAVDTNTAFFRTDKDSDLKYAVENGRMSQEQADTILEKLNEKGVQCYYTIKV